MNKKTTMIPTQSIRFTREAVKTIVFTCLVFVPALSFIIVFYLNPNINIYQENYDLLNKFFDKHLLPTTTLIQTLMWIGFVLLFFGLILMAFSPLIFRNSKEKYYLKNTLVGVFVISLLTSIIIFGMAQFYYSKFFDMYSFMLDINIANDDLNELKILFLDQYNNNQIFGWSSNVGTWWVCFFQIIGSTTIGFLFLVKINPSLHDESQADLIKRNIGKRRIGQSKFQILVERISVNNERSLSIWLMLLSVLIFLPQLIFIVSSVAKNSVVRSIFDWTFKAPKFYAFSNPQFGEAISESPSAEAFIIYLPIIMAGFLIASVTIFLLIYLRALAIKKHLFIFQFALVFVELVATIIVNTIAIHKINEIINIWNANDQELLHLISSFENTSIFNNTILKYSQTGIADLFITGNQYISLCIISVGAAICIYAVFFKKMLKFTKYSKTLIK